MEDKEERKGIKREMYKVRKKESTKEVKIVLGTSMDCFHNVEFILHCASAQSLTWYLLMETERFFQITWFRVKQNKTLHAALISMTTAKGRPRGIKKHTKSTK
jgi:hypothetical protein